MTDSLRVLYLSAEAAPFMQVGALADTAGALPPALRALERTKPLDVRMVLPFHPGLQSIPRDMHRVASFEVAHTNGHIPVEAYAAIHQQTPVYFISGPPITAAGRVYSNDPGYDAYKYIFFSLAALELARRLNWQPDIVHANEWHTASAVYWLALHRSQDAFYARTSSVLTFHNLPYLGAGAEFSMYAFGLPPSQDIRLPAWARQLPLPLGLLTADYLTTVSQGYAHEVTDAEHSSGLQDLILSRQANLKGILNGIDTALWECSNDPYLSVGYTKDGLGLREANKVALLNQLGLITSPTRATRIQGPMLAFVNPLDYHKGADVAMETIEALSMHYSREAQQWWAIFLGGGLPELEESAHKLEARLPNHVRFTRRSEAALLHQVFGAADILLFPGRDAPFDRNLLIGMHYGCAPVVFQTGGLADPVNDGDNQRTGFMASEKNGDAFGRALQRALNSYTHPLEWQAIQRAAMQADFSWAATARQYQAIYNRLKEVYHA